MKKLLIGIALLSVFISCKKTSYVAKFDKTPQERAADQINLVSTTLTGAPNGWIATLPTRAGGGYAFYLTFDNQQNVKMYGDLNDASATTFAPSYYRVKQDIGTDLVFDSYSYLAMLNDPNSAVLGGQSQIGYQSDVDFTFDKIVGDSIHFIGKKYRQPFKLVKATAAQKAVYEANGYKTAIDKFKAFFAAIKNPYIEVGTGADLIKTGMSVNVSNNLTLGKRIAFTGVKSDNVTVLSGNGKYAFTLDGAEILGGLVYNGITFVRVGWKDATTMAFYDSTGKEYIIKSNAVPLTPLSLLFGFPTTFPYKRITIPAAGLPTGVTSGFTAVYNQMRTLFTSSGRAVSSTAFILSSNSIFTVEVNYTSGTSAFVASATYNYTKVGDVITLDNNPVPNVNWPTRAVQIKPLADYMLTGPFKIDWAVSTNPSAGTLGGFYRTGDLSSFIYGNM